MVSVTRKVLSSAISRLMPRIIQGVQLEFLVKRALTQTQFLVLVAVHSRGPCPMNILSRSMHVSMPTMTGIINRLVKNGYINRLASEDDRRQVKIELSGQGQAMIAEFQKSVSRRWEDVLKDLDQKDIEDFHRVVGRLSEQLKDGR